MLNFHNTYDMLNYNIVQIIEGWVIVNIIE